MSEKIVSDLPSGGHWTRALDFSPDGKTLYVAVGAGGNAGEGLGQMPQGWADSHPLGESWSGEQDRAAVLAFDPDGSHRRIFATGIRNCAGLVVRPGTSDLYCTTNERDGLGDNLVPDYMTRVSAGSFFGWPWFYLGHNQDPRHPGERQDLTGKIAVPDLLFESHSAPLGFTFYHAPAGATHPFPTSFEGAAFVALHGSWNTSVRTGSKVVMVRLKDGKPVNSYEDFLTGLIIDAKTVGGRPVGVAVGPDGALYVSDDGGGKIWRITPQ